MPRILSPEQLLQKLNHLKASTVPFVEGGMKKATMNVEAKAKENCTPGKSPYYRAPYTDDNDPDRVPPHMRDVMWSKVVVSGNIVRGTVGNTKDYSLPVHEGTYDYKIDSSKGESSQWSGTGRNQSSGGGKGMPPRPFLMDAIKEKERETRIFLTDALMNAVKQECE